MGRGSNLSSQGVKKLMGIECMSCSFEFPWPSDYSSGPWLTGHSMKVENPTKLNLSHHTAPHDGRLPNCRDPVQDGSQVSCRPSLRDTARPKRRPLHQPRCSQLNSYTPILLHCTVKRLLRWRLHCSASKLNNFVLGSITFHFNTQRKCGAMYCVNG